jgi:hypothetical protein
VLALLATIQTAAPFNPVPASERNLLVAGIAIAAANWATWTWGWGRPQAEPGLGLRIQGCWAVALLAPAIVTQTVRPEALGAVLVPHQLPLKVGSLLLFLACLPYLLGLLPEAAPQGVPGASGRKQAASGAAGFALVRVLLWFPICGLFASVYVPVGGDELLAAVRFGISALGAAAVAIAIAANLTRRAARVTERLYDRAVLPLAAAVVILGAATSVIR